MFFFFKLVTGFGRKPRQEYTVFPVGCRTTEQAASSMKGRGLQRQGLELLVSMLGFREMSVVSAATRSALPRSTVSCELPI